MHKKYAAQDVVILAVNLDQPPANTQEKQSLLQDIAGQLQRSEVRFTSLLLDEDLQLRQQKLHFVAPPCVFVFNRQGQWRRIEETEAGLDPHEVEKLVVQFLQEK
jgi:hypothetical protein